MHVSNGRIGETVSTLAFKVALQRGVVCGEGCFVKGETTAPGYHAILDAEDEDEDSE